MIRQLWHEINHIKLATKKTILNIDPIDFSIKLTVFFLLLHFSNAVGEWLFIPIITLSSIGILFKKTRESLIFWLIQVAFYAYWVSISWTFIDNHMYLWAYWLIAVLVVIITKKQHYLPISAKYLIASCMFYAVLQKLTSPTYLDGSFFYFTILTDQRLSFLGKLIQYDVQSIISDNSKILDMLMSNTESYQLNGGPWILKPISAFLSWYTIFIESILSIIFFLKQSFYFWQHLLLLTFCTLYFLLPIKGFAFTLLILGFSNLKKEDLLFKSAYLFFFFYIFTISVLVMKDFIL